MDNQRNLILAVVLSAIVLFGWSLLADYIAPTAAPPSTKVVEGKQVALPKPEAAPDAPAAIRDRRLVLAESPRVAIATPRLAGSINLKGARIDDLTLTTYPETIAKGSAPVRLLSPGGTRDAYFMGLGWSGEGIALPGPDTVWQADGTRLAPGTPVTLSWDNGRGQLFQIRFTVDATYLFTVTQLVQNRAPGAIAVRPYGLISRVGHSHDRDSWTMHTGPIGSFGARMRYDIGFDDLDEGGADAQNLAQTGWAGFGDKYWLTALVPVTAKDAITSFRTAPGSRYQADVTSAPVIVSPGKVHQSETRLFAGAKEVALLDDYEAKLGIPQFGKAIDWGWFEIVEKPIFYLLDWLFKTFGNFGVAIILLTCIVRLLMFPIAQRQFRSMAQMRVLQPKMKALQERHKDDKPALQQEMMKLYQSEKVNPLAGCLPIFLQIPIFYALYKVLMLTIEMRHQPFILWIRDLSAPDPLTPVNLFGLLPFTPPAMIGIGVLPIILGVTMYLQFKLNPQPMDDVQKQVFALMPWVFMFIMAGYATGLVLYWSMSNILTIAQQGWLYRQHPGMKDPVPASKT